jgi:hypothetical protein
MRFGRSLRDDEVLALDEAARRQRGDERLAAIVERAHRGAGGQQSQPIDTARLLRARRKRPKRQRRGRRSESEHEFTALHRFTSWQDSARALVPTSS